MDPGPLGRRAEPGSRKFGSRRVRADLLAGVTPSEAAIVDAATRGVEVVRSHRRAMDALRATAVLLSELSAPCPAVRTSRRPAPRLEGGLISPGPGSGASTASQTRPFASARRRTGGPGTSRAPCGAGSRKLVRAGVCANLLAGVTPLRPPSSMRRRAGSRSGACPTSRRSGSIDPDVPGPSLWTSAWIFVSAPTSSSSGTAIVPVAGASLHMNFQE